MNFDVWLIKDPIHHSKLLVEGATLSEVAKLTQLDPNEIERAVKTRGRYRTDKYQIFNTEDQQIPT